MDSAEVATAARELVAECQRLRDEIGRLRRILIDNDIDPDPIAPKREGSAPSNLPCVQLTTPQKIELFRSLFRGRDDVYDARWESPDGRHGYSPVAQREAKQWERTVFQSCFPATARSCGGLRDPVKENQASARRMPLPLVDWNSSRTSDSSIRIQFGELATQTMIPLWIHFSGGGFAGRGNVSGLRQ